MIEKATSVFIYHFYFSHKDLNFLYESLGIPVNFNEGLFSNASFQLNDHVKFKHTLFFGL